MLTCVVPNGHWSAGTVIKPFHWQAGPLPPPEAPIPDGGAIPRALRWRRILEEQPWLKQKEIADNEGITQGLISRYLRLTELPNEIIDFVLSLESEEDRRYFSERKLRTVVVAPDSEKLAVFYDIRAEWVKQKRRDKKKRRVKLASLASPTRSRVPSEVQPAPHTAGKSK